MSAVRVGALAVTRMIGGRRNGRVIETSGRPAGGAPVAVVPAVPALGDG